MQPAVTAETFEVPHPVGQGRFLSNESEFLFSLLCDPFVLSRTRALPRMRLAGEPIGTPASTLLCYAHPTPGTEDGIVDDVIDAGGRAVLNRPSASWFGRTRVLSTLGRAPQSLVSLKERWDLGALAGQTYYYPDRERFLVLDPDRGRALSMIGGNPDLTVADTVAVFAGDPMAATLRYMNAACFGRALGDFASLLTLLVSELTGRPLSAAERRRFGRTWELRRDFHALGFACLTVQELDRCYGGGWVDLGPVGALAVNAADRLAAGDRAAARKELAAAFRRLETENRRRQPAPAVFTDTLHGGGLFGDLGYFEFDWPQHPADVLDTHLRWAHERSYRFNIDFGADCVKFMAERFPGQFRRLREAQDAGLVEFVNGSVGQPYPPLYSLESLVRQFVRGNAVLERVLGRPARVYASQEFGFCPQVASLLQQTGYRAAVLRVQNMGDAPTLRDERILWTAPNGDAIETLPSHPYKSERENGVTYNNLHLKVFAHQATGLDFAAFSGLGDISYYRPFREELARTCHYAPVFGHFTTWSEYFSRRPARPLPARCFQLSDFESCYGFMDIEGKWQANRPGTGHASSSCMRSMAAGDLFRATELLEVAAAIRQGDPARRGSPSEPWWDSLLHYQSHDVHIAPYYKAGSFLGGVISHRSVALRRGHQNVADYGGPWDYMHALERAEMDLDAAEAGARRSIRRALRRLVPAHPERDRYAVLNPGPAGRRVVCLPRAAGAAVSVGDAPLVAQAWGRDVLVLADLPAFGLAVLEATGPGADMATAGEAVVRGGEDFLENSLLRAKFDVARGTLERLVRKSDGAELLVSGSHSFSLPGDDSQVCRRARVVAAGPVRGALELEIVVGSRRGRTARIRSTAVLDAGRALLRFEQRVLRCPEIRGDQWTNHLGLRFRLPTDAPALTKSYSNVLEPSPGGNVLSRNLLLAGTPSGDVLFVNHGNQFYRCEGGDIRAIMVVEQEPGRRFAHAVGFAAGNPVMQARAFVQPLFVERVRGKAGVAVASPSGAGSLVSIDSADVELLSCRPEAGLLELRLANTTPRRVRACVRFRCELESAWLTDLRGNRLADLDVRRDGAVVDLRPWDVRQVVLAPARDPVAPFVQSSMG